LAKYFSPPLPVKDTTIIAIDDLDPTKKLKFELASLDAAETATITVLGDVLLPDTGGAGIVPAVDTTAIIKGSADATKLVRFEVDGLTTGTTRVITVPDNDLTLDDIADTRTPASHALGGAEHSADTLSNLNTKVSDATLIDTADSRLSDARTPTAHTLGGSGHTADTLANLNTKVSDATLIDTGDSRLSDSRTPTAHKASHQDGGGDEISVAALSGTLADAQKIAVEDDGSLIGTRATLNFTGGGVTVTDDSGNDEIDIDIPLVAGDSTSTTVSQSSHGLSVGDPVRNNGTIYVLAKSDTVANVEAFGIVSAVPDVNNFTVITAGFVSGLSGLTKGAVHFVSATGTLTTTEPTISKPVLFADSTTSGFWINMRGFDSAAASSGIWEKTQSVSVTSSTALVDLDLDGTSKLWMVTITGAKPASDQAGNNFDARVLVGGVVETGTVYRDVAERTSGASYSGQGSQGRAFMSLVPGVGGAAGESMMLSILIANPGSTVDDKLFSGKGTYIHNDSGCRKNTFASSFNTQASAIDGFRVYFELSNIIKAEIIVHKMLEF